MTYNLSRFFCLNCGEETISLPRKKGKQRKSFHRKKLYCYHCQNTINCVECKNDEDIQIFKEEFSKGVYENEAQESLDIVRCAGLGQKHMGSQPSSTVRRDYLF